MYSLAERNFYNVFNKIISFVFHSLAVNSRLLHSVDCFIKGIDIKIHSPEAPAPFYNGLRLFIDKVVNITVSLGCIQLISAYIHDSVTSFAAIKTE